MAGAFGWNSWRLRHMSLVNSAIFALACISAAAGVAFVGLNIQLEIEYLVTTAAALILALIYALVLLGLPAHAHAAFGYANGVTAARAAMVSYVGAVVLFADGFGLDLRLNWTIVAVVAVALALDGVDGYLARRFRQESVLGARFDMEVDALLIMILSLAVWFLDKAGPWVLLIGLMRYGFVAAQRLEPRLAGELAPSFRRKAVCVLQGVALCLIVAPVVSVPLSSWIAAAALAGLTYSFAADIYDLLRK